MPRPVSASCALTADMCLPDGKPATLATATAPPARTATGTIDGETHTA